MFGIQTCSAPVARGGAAAALETVAAGAEVVAVALVAAVVPDAVTAVETGAVTADEAGLLVADVADAAVATEVLVDAAAVVTGCDDVPVAVAVLTAAPPQALRRAKAPTGRMIAVNARRRDRRE